jgi:hypothetical protein
MSVKHGSNIKIYEQYIQHSFDTARLPVRESERPVIHSEIRSQKPSPSQGQCHADDRHSDHPARFIDRQGGHQHGPRFRH